MEKPHLLFVCSRNQWRSPTAEDVYRNDPRIAVRSAGVSEQSRRRLSSKDLDWADLVLVMERDHKSRILERFRDHADLPPIVCLDIPDDYERGAPELISLIRKGTEMHLQQYFEIEPTG